MKEILYKSTRSDSVPVPASKAILMGLAEDGGLFVPTQFPELDRSLSDLAYMDYCGVAYEVMKLMLTDFTEDELKNCIRNAYGTNFDDREIVPLRKADGAWYLELFHGPTIAFKDMALQILPHLLTTSARKNQEQKEIVILTATSGDTGKAAMAGFADVPGTRIMVFYPKDGVSSIQERQMVTQKGDNTRVVGIRGNFDDAQSEVKKIFSDAQLRSEMADRGFAFSSANSINVGRLVPQIVYYVFAYTRLLKQGVIKEGEKINIVVPTGNFGNILAAYYGAKMGLPVNKLVCASNSNKVLFDFFSSGTYDRNREFILTSSPSMDILISSNLERLIYHISGNSAAKTASLMKALAEKGAYAIDEEMKAGLSMFVGGYATEEQTAEAIRRLYEKEGYVIDPHTAVAAYVYDSFRAQTGSAAPAVIASTASPFKFENSVMRALGEPADLPDLELADRLSEKAGVPVPEAVNVLRTAEVRHNIVCDREGMKEEVRRFLGM